MINYETKCATCGNMRNKNSDYCEECLMAQAEGLIIKEVSNVTTKN